MAAITSRQVPLATCRRFDTLAYVGIEGFLRFMNDRVGAGWYVAARRRPASMGDRPNVTQRRYRELEAEFRARFGAIGVPEAAQ